jgi:hypothetical protein
MSTIENIVRSINLQLLPQFEDKLRSFLLTQDKEWLIEQIVRLTVDSRSLQDREQKLIQETKAKKRVEKIARLRKMGLNREQLVEFLQKYENPDRQKLIAQGYLLPIAPVKGSDAIAGEHRTEKGNELLQHSKDILFALLFGDEHINTHFHRIEQELLTLTLPRHKAEALDFMKATTELSAFGTWQDPESVSNDARADNVVLEVEYGEVEGELIGNGIVLTLRLINNLEVNEQILYARMINIEQSTLIT